MKNILTAVALSLTSMTAFAQQAGDLNTPFAGRFEAPYGEARHDPVSPGTSGLTRADVQRELQSAIARGEQIAYGEARHEPLKPGTSRLSRAEVRAELLAAIESGEQVTYGEGGPAPVIGYAAGAAQQRPMAAGGWTPATNDPSVSLW